ANDLRSVVGTSVLNQQLKLQKEIGATIGKSG
ncbi:hypothetical protein KCO_22408, partial [Pectobacterium brasiliense ICMP 19477]